jgi:hypothetical protein
MWRILSVEQHLFQNYKDTPLLSSVHPQLSLIPPLVFSDQQKKWLSRSQNGSSLELRICLYGIETLGSNHIELAEKEQGFGKIVNPSEL